VYRSWMTDENRVVMATGPSHEGGTRLPEEEALRALYAEAEQLELKPYEDGLADQPLVAVAPAAGAILEKSFREDLGLTTYKLSNGVTVTLKPTDFKEDEILFSGWRAGGMNLASPDEWLSARLASPVAEVTGMGAFSSVDLQKMLS